jgi:hypothetical protein
VPVPPNPADAVPAPAPAAAPARAPGPGPATGGAAVDVDVGGDGGAPEPFSRRLGQALRFPLQRPALLNNAAAAAVFGAGALVLFPQAAAAPARTALLLALAWAGATLVLCRFLVLVVERTAAGYFDARAYPAARAGTDWRRLGRFLALLVVVPLALTLLVRLHVSGLLLMVPALLFSLWLPAALMLLTTNDDLSIALGLQRGLDMARRVDLPYLLLALAPLVLCLLVEGAGSVLAGLAPSAHLPPLPGDAAPAPGAATPDPGSPALFAFLAVLLAAVVNGVLLILAVQLGFAMHQHSGALGIAVVGPGGARVRGAVSSASHERRLREAVIAKLVAAGEFREAIELISEDLRERPTDLSLHVRLHAVLLQEGAGPRIEEHADRYLVLLLGAGNAAQAVELFEQTRARFPAFVPRDPDRLVDLARAAIDALKPQLGAELVRGFDKKYPGHPRTAEVYVLGARILLIADKSSQAKGLLKHVTTSYPDSPAAAEAKRYLARFA